MVQSQIIGYWKNNNDFISLLEIVLLGILSIVNIFNLKLSSMVPHRIEQNRKQVTEPKVWYQLHNNREDQSNHQT